MIPQGMGAAYCDFYRKRAVFLDKVTGHVYNLIVFLYGNKPRKEGVRKGWTFQRGNHWWKISRSTLPKQSFRVRTTALWRKEKYVKAYACVKGFE